jgi:ubiquinone/menaquinone biosynthesis C-methylase UbiE
MRKDYLAVIYDDAKKPFTDYPDNLTRNLTDRFQIKPKSKLLEEGCGRGEFLRGFYRCGIDVCGVNQSEMAKTICPEAEFKIANLEEEIPYENDYFDVVYSKSVIEHFYYPEKLVAQIYRVLKPRGLVITMTQDCEHHFKNFYDDYTHRTPFKKNLLDDILRIYGFKNVQVEHFRQLPVLSKFPWLQPVSKLVRWCTPRSLGKSSKVIRFSKEVMLLG